ncbi:MAG TPA: NACHT domain-containing protein [Nostocaceae cyanobacterium]|nr:NACHT domain-containing protein [Nostocaceae cyanobacterium]
MTEIDPLMKAAITPFVAAIATPIFKSIWETGVSLTDKVGKKFDETAKQLIFDISREYENNYTKRHGNVKVLGMREPVSLESIYTRVQFLDKDSIVNFESIENLEKYYRESKNRRFQTKDCEKKPGIEVANKKQYLMVLGRPGAGKSTFLRKMGLEALKGKNREFQHNCIPVFIELKRFTSSDIDIEKCIIDEFKTCKFPEPEQFTAKALEDGKLLILLDGLDEVPTVNVNDVITKIQDFVDKNDKNRFIASCRIAAYRNSFRRFSDVIMADFDEQQIEQFILNWFHSEQDQQAETGKKCWELLQKPEYAAAKELAHTPLLLTFLCLVYDRSQNFPNNRSVLYKKALRILLEEWASEKRINRDKIYEGLHTELEEILLSEIAYTNFADDRLFFSQREIVQQIKTFLASNLNAPQHLDGEAVLNAIAVQQGILVERAEEVFSFSHLTLQEYLTAQYIDDNRLIEKLVTAHLTDQRWKEVFLLVAGVMRCGADELLLLMEKQAQKYINTPKLQALLQWAEDVTVGSDGNYKPVGKRALAIAIAYANAYAYSIAYANAIAYAIANAITYAYAIANANAITKAISYIRKVEESKIFNLNLTALIDELEALKAKIPDDKQPKAVHQDFAKNLFQTLLNGFNLTSDMVNLSEEEIQSLDNYLYANYLIIQCKDAAVRVSRETWKAIEDRMLLPPSNS